MYNQIISKPKIVLFDWDNTIVSTQGIFSKVLSITIEKLNLDREIFNSQAYKETRNRSVRDSFPRIFGGDWEAIWEEYNQCYIDVLNERGGVIMADGAEEFLNHLRAEEIPLGIVSNKNHDLLLYEIKNLQINHFFASIVGAGKAEEDKPSALHADHAIDEILALNSHLKIEKESDCWLVGDSDVDISCAINAKCFPVLLNCEGHNLQSKRYLNDNKVPHLHSNSFNDLIMRYKEI